MSLLIFASDEKQQQKLLQVIAPYIRNNPMELLTDTRALNRRLRQNLIREDLLVLMIADKAELKRITRLADFLDGLRIVLILPDHGRETVALGHILYPRFVSYRDSDFQDVREVIGNMLEKTSNKNISFCQEAV